MKDKTFESLQIRLQALERRLRLVTIIAALIAVTVGLIGAWIAITVNNPGVLRARAIEVVDETGKPLIGLDARGSDARYVIPHRKGTPILGLPMEKGRPASRSGSTTMENLR